MKFVTKNQKVFKIVPENKTTYGASLRKSMKNEVSSVMTDDELDTLPWYIIEDNNMMRKLAWMLLQRS